VNDFAMRVVLGDVARERNRQEVKCAEKRAEGENWRTPADPLCTDDVRFPVLAEEFGEVAKELNDARAEGRPPGPNLRVELVQLAAVAVAWVEALDEDSREAAA
jgi:NTP pyrophosphatase (non-canonical NTP hydrolase)